MHYPSAAILSKLDNVLRLPVEVALKDEGDTAWNPASTKSFLRGPARITYTQHPDGAVEATEGPLEQRGPALPDAPR